VQANERNTTVPQAGQTSKINTTQERANALPSRSPHTPMCQQKGHSLTCMQAMPKRPRLCLRSKDMQDTPQGHSYNKPMVSSRRAYTDSNQTAALTSHVLTGPARAHILPLDLSKIYRCPHQLQAPNNWAGDAASSAAGNRPCYSHRWQRGPA